MYRSTWMEVNLDAIMENVRRIRRICGKKFIAVLKADAYGCGDIQVARAVLEAGADMLAVSSLDEAMMLRNEGYQGELLILGSTDPADCSVMVKNNISATAYSMQWIEEVSKHECDGFKVHLKVDTGMNRIGFHDLAELKQAKQLLLDSRCDLEGIFTHFACAESSREMTDRQYLKFAEAVKAMNYPFRWIHCDNSAATISFRDPLSNACRVGISLYGISDVPADLLPAISLYTKIFMTKTVPAGQTISYGATYTTSSDKIIATVPIGYADGFIRANQGRKVWADGVYPEIVGRVCMDQCMLKMPEYRPEGTTVEIFGSHIRIEDMAKDLNTIPYEIICLISGRVTRRYILHGKAVGEENERLKRSEFDAR